MNVLLKHWRRLKRSWGRRYREALLPAGYLRLGTRYGGWWVDGPLIGKDPLLIDCGLGEDLSFPAAFLQRFGGRVLGVEPNPRSLEYCRRHCPPGMAVLPNAIWTRAGETLTFYLPRPQDQLPKGADGVSGSLFSSHHYVAGGDSVTATTIDLAGLLATQSRSDCDVLKLDVEGAEYEILPALCRTGDILRTRQLLVEFHHGSTHHTPDDTRTVVESVKAAGFELVHQENRNYVFRRPPSGHRP